MKTYKSSMIAIAVIYALVASAMFFVLNITPIFIAAYVFALIAVAAALVMSLYLLENKESYPWAAALPFSALQYLIIEAIFSAIILVLEQTGVFTLPIGWFIIIHIIILAFFASRLIALNAGKAEIERVGEKTAESTADWRRMLLKMQSIAARATEAQSVLELMRYSDPVTPPEAERYNREIDNAIALLEDALSRGEREKPGELCLELTRQINDRNNFLKAYK